MSVQIYLVLPVTIDNVQHAFSVTKMKEASKTNNVVCRVKPHKLLVRFKDRSPLQPTSTDEQGGRGRPRTPRYSKEERDVSALFEGIN